MLSICIPVYNYDVTTLVKEIHNQCSKADIDFEIIVLDDASTNEEIKTRNESIQLPYFEYHSSEKNRGNALTRNEIIEKTKYNFLIFLDADVIPVNSDFISNYLKSFRNYPNKIITGNIVYDKNRFSKNYSLRWKYGKSKEEVSLKEREKNKIKNITAANFSISKFLLKKKRFKKVKRIYGFVDIAFFSQFNESDVIPIKNAVYHNGLEENTIFLHKSESSVENALIILDHFPNMAKHIALLQLYKKVRPLKFIFSFFYKHSHSFISKNLHSNNPSILLFQLYKLLYIGYLDSKS